VLEGNDLLHWDVRSDNICLLPDRVVFVDWNLTLRGPRQLDLASWLPSLRLEGGPLPEAMLAGYGEYAAAIAGYFADRAPQAPPAGAPTVREIQLRQLRIALPWACRALGLPEPDLPWAQRAIDHIDADLAAGRIADEQWHQRIESVIGDAYLSYAEPWRQSGKGGDEADWRWSRELILDAFPGSRGAFLDVGCANGYLMECVHRWGQEQGLHIEPHGVDISWRLASLARRRLPHWGDRISTANILDWTPPRRFDVVNTGLDYVPPRRRRRLVEHLLRDVVAPGGRVVLRPWRVDGTEPDPAQELAALGFQPDGGTETRHPQTGELRRTVWVTRA
jgi:SAM-dependent methyltransferase